MRISLAADHAGLLLKEELVQWLRDLGHVVQDLGPRESDPNDDYPDSALLVAQSVAQGAGDRGVVVCGSGVGASVTANKVPGIRACLCHDTYTAHQGVEHDDMNILCLGARVVGVELARDIVQAFVNAEFSGEERHTRRLKKILAIERHYLEGNNLR